MRGGKGVIHMSNESFSVRLRMGVTVFAILASPAFWLFGQEPRSPELPAPEVVTMAGMSSLVPSLVAAGWGNFFLDLRQSLGMSDEQAQRLYLIRQTYLGSSEGLEEEHRQAQLSLYHNLESDAVSYAKIESDLKRIAELKAAISAAHFRAILEAINVLDHRQHLGAAEWLKLRWEMRRQEPSGRDILRMNVPAILRTRLARRPKWPSNFTPRELWWKGW